MHTRRLISLYTGAGGLDLGFEAAGYTVAAALEHDPEAVSTIRKNRSWPVIAGDIGGIGSRQILDTAGLAAGDADLLMGGPPCQPFSKAGYWVSGSTLRLNDPRAGTLAAFLRVLRDTLPRCFLLENVPGLAYRGKSEGITLVERTVEVINQECGTAYRLSVMKLNAAHFGVPQLRERVFVVGDRDGQVLEPPAVTHDGKAEPYRTAWDAIGDLPEDRSPELAVRGKWADLLPSVPEGRNYLWHTDRGGGEPLFGWRRRYWSFLLKLDKGLPSWTIPAQPGPATGPFHWANRRLSARELCRLQTFPDDYRVHGSLQSVQRQLGNAVPAALAEVLARMIRRKLFVDEIGEALTLLPPRRLPVPPAEKLGPVTARYHYLIGSHEPHPGAGRGPGIGKGPGHRS